MAKENEVLDLLDRPIAFQRSFVSLGVGVTGALFLSQAVYWSRRSGSDGWFWKTSDEWEAETGMTRREQDTARRLLRDLEILVEDKRGIPCKTWYKLDVEKLKTRLAESAKLDWRKAPNSVGGKRQTNTETTSETTAETTNTISSRANPDQSEKHAAFNAAAYLAMHGVELQVVEDWLKLRKAKKAAVTKTAVEGIEREAKKAGIDITGALRICCERGWSGFKAEWLISQRTQDRRNSGGNERHERLAEHTAILTGRHRQQQPEDDPAVIHGTAERLD